MNLIYTTLGGLVLGVTIGWTVHGWKVDSAKVELTEKQAIHQDESAVAHEIFKEVERIKYVKILQGAEEVARLPFYRDDSTCLDDAGLQLLRLATGEATSEPAPTLPASSGTY